MLRPAGARSGRRAPLRCRRITGPSHHTSPRYAVRRNDEDRRDRPDAFPGGGAHHGALVPVTGHVQLISPGIITIDAGIKAGDIAQGEIELQRMKCTGRSRRSGRARAGLALCSPQKLRHLCKRQWPRPEFPDPPPRPQRLRDRSTAVSMPLRQKHRGNSPDHGVLLAAFWPVVFDLYQRPFLGSSPCAARFAFSPRRRGSFTRAASATLFLPSSKDRPRDRSGLYAVTG